MSSYSDNYVERQFDSYTPVVYQHDRVQPVLSRNTMEFITRIDNFLNTELAPSWWQGSAQSSMSNARYRSTPSLPTHNTFNFGNTDNSTNILSNRTVTTNNIRVNEDRKDKKEKEDNTAVRIMVAVGAVTAIFAGMYHIGKQIVKRSTFEEISTEAHTTRLRLDHDRAFDPSSTAHDKLLDKLSKCLEKSESYFQGQADDALFYRNSSIGLVAAGSLALVGAAFNAMPLITAGGLVAVGAGAAICFKAGLNFFKSSEQHEKALAIQQLSNQIIRENARR